MLHFIWWQVACSKACPEYAEGWQVTLAKVICNLQPATCNQNQKCQFMSFRSISQNQK
jgi:hypothetical protein